MIFPAKCEGFFHGMECLSQSRSGRGNILKAAKITPILVTKLQKFQRFMGNFLRFSKNKDFRKSSFV